MRRIPLLTLLALATSVTLGLALARPGESSPGERVASVVAEAPTVEPTSAAPPAQMAEPAAAPLREPPAGVAALQAIPGVSASQDAAAAGSPPAPVSASETEGGQEVTIVPAAGESGPPESAPPAVPEACNRPAPPLPPPGSADAAQYWQAFRTPLPAAPAWNPPGPKRVGLQVGHWRLEELPAELGRLGGGAVGGGKAEWEVNLEIAVRAAEMLESVGVEVDLLPATVPAGYRAHAFLSIHADGDESGALRGFKLARAAWSAAPETDDRLLAAMYGAYGEATGLPRDDAHISRRMTAYYVFNSRRYCHAVAPGVPAAILEAGFLTSAVDRQMLLGDPDAAARGIANGLLRFLDQQD